MTTFRKTQKRFMDINARPAVGGGRTRKYLLWYISPNAWQVCAFRQSPFLVIFLGSKWLQLTASLTSSIVLMLQNYRHCSLSNTTNHLSTNAYNFPTWHDVTLHITRQAFSKLKFETIWHPPYSPDLSIPPFFLHHKRNLNSKCIATDVEDVKKAMTACIQESLPAFFLHWRNAKNCHTLDEMYRYKWGLHWNIIVFLLFIYLYFFSFEHLVPFPRYAYTCLQNLSA